MVRDICTGVAVVLSLVAIGVSAVGKKEEPKPDHTVVLSEMQAKLIALQDRDDFLINCQRSRDEITMRRDIMMVNRIGVLEKQAGVTPAAD